MIEHWMRNSELKNENDDRFEREREEEIFNKESIRVHVRVLLL